MTEPSEMYQQLRGGHSISLRGHSPCVVPMVHTRSSTLLPNRGPSFPALAIDNSVEFTNESIYRRQLHSSICSRDPNVFRKRSDPESASSLLKQRNMMNDLMAGMHGLRDVNVLDKERAKRVNFSILREKDLKKKKRIR